MEPIAETNNPQGSKYLARGPGLPDRHSALCENFVKLAGVFRERGNLDAVAVQHREIEIAEGAFVGMLVTSAMPEAEILAAGENDRIVAGIVRGACAAAKEGHGGVEQPFFALTDGSEPAQEVGK